MVVIINRDAQGNRKVVAEYGSNEFASVKRGTFKGNKTIGGGSSKNNEYVVPVVVSGRPDISGDTAKQISDYQKEIKGRVEISDVSNGVINVRPSSTDALSSNMAYAKSLEAGGVRTAGDLFNNKVSSPSSSGMVINNNVSVTSNNKEVFKRELNSSETLAPKTNTDVKGFESAPVNDLRSVSNEPTGEYGDLIKTTPFYPLFKLGKKAEQKAEQEELNAFRSGGVGSSAGDSSTIKTIGYSFGSKAISTSLFVVDTPRQTLEVAKNPVSTGTTLGVMAVDVVKNPFEYGYSFGDKLKNSPIQTGSNILFDTAIYPVAVSKGSQLVRDAGVRAFAEKVEASSVFDAETLAKVEKGKLAFSLTKSPEQTIKTYSEVGNVAVSASPEPLKTLGQSRLVRVGKGTSSDVGLFTTPLGSGSPYFLKINKVYEPLSDVPSFSLLPQVSKPTISVITGIKNVERVPKNILEQGVEATNKYVESLTGKGKAFVTRGSEASSNPSLKFDKATGKKAFATSEMEANIPPNSVLVQTGNANTFLGYSKYVEVNGRPIPLREYKLVQDAKIELGTSNNKKIDVLDSSYSSSRKAVSPLSVSGNIYSGGHSSSNVFSSASSLNSPSSLSSSSGSSSSIIKSSSVLSSSKTYVSRPVSSSPVSVSRSSVSRSSVSRPVSSSPISYPVVSSPISRVSYTSYKPLTTISRPVTSKSSYPVKNKYIIKPNTSGKKLNRKNSFIAQVKKRGKFVSVGVFDSSERAFSSARRDVSNTASASLRVLKVGGGVVSPSGFLGSQFRLSKKDSGVLVERRSQRIKSGGEKAEITYKGIMVNRNKKVFGGLRI